MAELSSRLVDERLPYAPYRQWTFSFPWRIRVALARDGRDFFRYDIAQMSMHRHEALFAEGGKFLLDTVNDDAHLAGDLARLVERADYFDVGDITAEHIKTLNERGVYTHALRKNKAKRWSVDKPGLHLLEHNWRRGYCQAALDWYLVLGWTLDAEQAPIAKLRKRRDVGKMRLLVADARAAAPGYRSEFDVLSTGDFADWWSEPLLDSEAPPPPDRKLDAALAHVEALPRWKQSRIELEFLASDGPVGWIDTIIAGGEQGAPRLLALIDDAPPHRALAAAVLLYHAVRRRRNKLPLSAVAAPLYELCVRGHRELEECDRAKDKRKLNRWIEGREIMPRGDLWEWLTSHLSEYGNRLEPWLVPSSSAATDIVVSSVASPSALVSSIV